MSFAVEEADPAVDRWLVARGFIIAFLGDTDISNGFALLDEAWSSMASDEGLDRLVGILKKDLRTRNPQLIELNQQLDRRNDLFEQQLAKCAHTYKWYAGLAGTVAVIFGIWVFTKIVHTVDDMGNTSDRMSEMQLYMKNMGEGSLHEGESNYTESMAAIIQNMSGDIRSMNEVIDSMGGGMGAMRGSMEGMSDTMSIMRVAMDGVNGDVRHMTDDVSGMNHSVGYMNQSVGRMARDIDYMKEPFEAMDDFMPW